MVTHRLSRLAERRKLRINLQDSTFPTCMEAAKGMRIIQLELCIVSEVLRSLTRTYWHDVRAQWARELRDEWSRRRFARVWHLCRKFAASSSGHKKRRYCLPRALQFNKEEWLADLSKPGCEGGFSATEVHPGQFIMEQEAQAPRPLAITNKERDLAKQDLKVTYQREGEAEDETKEVRINDLLGRRLVVHGGRAFAGQAPKGGIETAVARLLNAHKKD